MKILLSIIVMLGLTIGAYANTKDTLKLAKGYYYGSSTVSQNYRKAKGQFLIAAKNHSMDAYRYLGVIYLFGHGTKVDKWKAKLWLKKAIARGDQKSRTIYNKYFESDNMAQSHKTTTVRHYKVIDIRSDDTLSVRTSAGSHNRKIGDLSYNAGNIKILTCRKSSRGGKWCRVQWGSTVGWVSARYLAPHTRSEEIRLKEEQREIEKQESVVADLERKRENLIRSQEENLNVVGEVVDEVNTKLPKQLNKYLTLERYVLSNNMQLNANITSHKSGCVVVNTLPEVVHVALLKRLCVDDTLSKMFIDESVFSYTVFCEEKNLRKKITKDECEALSKYE